MRMSWLCSLQGSSGDSSLASRDLSCGLEVITYCHLDIQVRLFLSVIEYLGFERPSDAVTIWNKSDIPTTHLLPNGSNLFGSFTMLDKYIATNPSEQDASYVDYGFGSDESIFAGCHRFQITRLPTQSGAESQVQMELLHFRCNPQKNKPSIAEYIERFHYVYAKALFANGIQYVITR
ncbi:hypothetical protein TSTA_004030 [Talaromyces stipitatus ATCC 10500]|uniref:Uncharacterized protein n=1 Tax=Talaromyces stipitatus (strain ATCC 10500 / CBS 375.48 / QM 6759 / NRRL 1006) TaxID=441959 RepID=B8MTA2_TALSN|nr:uncharacterized protein TSTA_004030 [Talaromyces stipitatus ATCC 10500]EED12352.1 hypothetical protein TSTA_004030 [Talaromyces stipitatus ATCC 10500]